MQTNFILLISFIISGCTNVMLHPDSIDHFPGFREAHIVEEHFLTSTDGVQINYWLIPAQSPERKRLLKSKGLIVLCHGNGNNLTDHIARSMWLAESGYDLLLFDYRGHGQSTGLPTVAGSYEDVESTLDFAIRLAIKQNQRVFFYGQSLGGTLLLKAMSKNPERWHPTAIVIEDPFFSFKEIAMERVNASGAPFPIGAITYLAFSNKYGLQSEELAAISPTPVLLFCSSKDPVVAAHHCRQVSEGLLEPKTVTHYEEHGHLQAMTSPGSKSRRILSEALSEIGRQNYRVSAENWSKH